MRQAGGRAIVQDEESSVIYGMPQAALNRAGADRVAALAGVATCIEEMLRLLRNSAA
jgi:chemotaxis response regulator CheB